MTRKLWSGLWSVILLAGLSTMGLRAADAPAAPGNPVRLLAVAPVEQPAGTSLEVRASGPFTFTSYQPHERHWQEWCRTRVRSSKPAAYLGYPNTVCCRSVMPPDARCCAWT